MEEGRAPVPFEPDAQRLFQRSHIAGDDGITAEDRVETEMIIQQMNLLVDTHRR